MPLSFLYRHKSINPAFFRQSLDCLKPRARLFAGLFCVVALARVVLLYICITRHKEKQTMLLNPDKKNRKQEAAILTGMIPATLRAQGWQIGRERHYHTFFQPFGPSYTLYGSFFEAQKKALEGFIWLQS